MMADDKSDLDLLSDFPVSSVDPVSDLPDANKTDEDDLMIETQESPVAIDAPPVDRLSLECPSGSSQESSGGGTVNPLTTASVKSEEPMSQDMGESVATHEVTVTKSPQVKQVFQLAPGGSKTVQMPQMLSTGGQSGTTTVLMTGKGPFTVPKGSQPILIPVAQNILSSPSALNDFINSIRPPVIPGSGVRHQIQIQKGQTTLTPIRPGAPRRPAPIAPAPSLQTLSGGSLKLVMTSNAGGQQVIQLQPTQVRSDPSGVKSITSSGQQFLVVSPVKQGMATKVATGLKQLAPAPTRIITSQSSAAGPKGDMKASNVQILRLVPSSSLTQGSKPGLRSIAPNTTPKTIQVTSAQAASIASAIGDFPGQKVTIIPAPKTGISGLQVSRAIVSGSQTSYITTSSSSGAQVIMLPAQLVQGMQGKTGIISSQTLKPSGPSAAAGSSRTFVPIAPSPLTSNHAIHPSSKEILINLTKASQQSTSSSKLSVLTSAAAAASSAADEINRQRKPCNCTKSQCLKLYCDCFANGEFCSQCNCNNCSNNLKHEEERQKAIRSCLERNPHAFHPKIGKGRSAGDVTERRHTKGCNCRRSGCLKNYCECYEAKILCSELCKCCGCKNYEDSFERKAMQLMHLADAAEFRSAQQNAASKIIWGNDYVPKLPVPMTSESQPCSFIKQEVVEAACQCLLVAAEEGEKKQLDMIQMEKSLLIEFGRCLTQIIDWADRSKHST